MTKTIAASLAAALLLAACAADPVNFAQGTWGPQPIVPPTGLVHSPYDGMVGATIATRSRLGALKVEAVLVDPRDGLVDYVIARPVERTTDLVAIPISAVESNSRGLYVDATDYTINALPHMTVAQLETSYAPGSVAAAPGYAGPGYYPPGVGPRPIAGEQLRLSRRGNLVGSQVVDGAGAPLGTVSSVALRPATGEVRFLIVAGPTLGPDFIAIPYGNSTPSNGRIVVNGTAAGWMQMPRYRGDQVVQVFGTLGAE
jgi:sporulation protein YlmC with PRC-barrel domain